MTASVAQQIPDGVIKPKAPSSPPKQSGMVKEDQMRREFERVFGYNELEDNTKGIVDSDYYWLWKLAWNTSREAYVR